ncbi:hypothetical protein [Saccharopolyspora taberi]|uniref:ABC transporter substrate-binding protein n=1 Tax=Saccharopolyspora taberi TaxID=60895 RepID=A0ABN3V3E6_9PSEU
MVEFVPKSWWQRNRARVLAAAVALVLVASAGVVVAWWTGRCANGVSRIGDECIGVTDGSYAFDDELAEVTRKIKAENDWVLQQPRPHVSIVYLAPMTLTEGDTITMASTRNGLEGAYLSQRRANRTAGWHGDSPLIRILLANPGSQFKQWEPVTRQIVGMRDSGSEPVVAVAGLGQSHEGTANAITALTRSRMPMVGATVTADGFTDRIDGGRSWMIRVAPPNSAQVRAVVDRLADTRSAMLVQDDNQSDVFARNLNENFSREYPRDGRELLQPQIYDSSLDTANSFSTIVTNICVAQPDAIFFSGRFGDLKDLLAALNARICGKRNLRVVTLDSLVNIAGIDKIKEQLSNMRLEYTQLAAPKAWDGRDQYFSTSATNDFRNLLASEFYRQPGDEEAAIMSYDAVGVAATAIRRAAENATQNPAPPVTSDAVFQQFYAMNGASVVPGASGWISLNERGDPQQKALSFFTLTGNGFAPGSPEVVSDTGLPLDPGL